MVGVLVLLALAFFTYRVLFPDDTVVIENLLNEMAAEASFQGEEAPLAKVSKAGKLAGYFTVDARITVKPFGYRQVMLNGRPEIREAAIAARSTVSSLAINVERVEVTVSDDRSTASVVMGATVTSSRQEGVWNQVFDLEMRRIEGDWLIHRVENREFIKQ